MAEVNYVITDKVIAFTKNKNTQVFVGAQVRKIKQNGNVFWRIGETPYSLTPAEFKTFASAGVIAQRIVKNHITQHETSRQQNAQAKRVQRSVQNTQNQAQQQVRQSAVRPVADRLEPLATGVADAKSVNIPSKDIMQSKIEKEANAMRESLKTTAFFESYPEPDLAIDVPEKMGFFDKTADLGQQLTGFFSRIGAKRDKSAKLERESNK